MVMSDQMKSVERSLQLRRRRSGNLRSAETLRGDFVSFKGLFGCPISESGPRILKPIIVESRLRTARLEQAMCRAKA